MHLNSTKIISLLFFIAIAVFLCFYKLGSPQLERWDEYTNHKVIKESLASENPLGLKYEDTPFFEKPPLWYWLTMASVKVFGQNSFSVRFISATAGFLVIITTFTLGWKMFSYKSGLIAGSVLLATQQLFVKHNKIFATHTFRSADLDSLQILFLLITTFLFYKFKVKIKERKWLIWAGIFTGLAFLAKGPFALIPAIVFFPYLFINRNRLKLKFLSIFTFLGFYILIFLIVTLPWHLYMYFEYRAEFMNQYFGYHLIGRGITVLEGHQGSVFYYVKLLFLSDFFFSGEILFGSIMFLAIKYKKKILTDFPLFSCFAVSCLLLLTVSLVQTKLTWYLLPFYPFAALIIGKALGEVLTSKNRIIKITAGGMILFTLCIQLLRNVILVSYT
ncbi:MAG: glycosyltransferase family 39 protein [Candidatus Dojkabacteria bacterium]|nr:glycosyltransferase family 39 protein [Candidatus Dojkabacteria bacterium]